MNLRLIFSLCVTVLIMAVLLWHIPPRMIFAQYEQLNVIYFTAGLIVFLPALVLIAFRWQKIVDNHVTISKKHAMAMTLVGCTFNAIAPSKLGDLVKAHDLLHKQVPFGSAIGAVLWEKYYDFTFVFVIGAIGLIISIPALAWFGYLILGLILFISILLFCPGILPSRLRHLVTPFKPTPRKFVLLMGITAIDWILQFIQIVLFFQSLGIFLPSSMVIIRSTVAILIGLLPITFAGMGTRDAALLFMFQDFLPSYKIMAVGFMLTFRYWFPAILGLPTTFVYLKKKRNEHKT